MTFRAQAAAWIAALALLATAARAGPLAPSVPRAESLAYVTAQAADALSIVDLARGRGDAWSRR
ncbi:hypothetical protein M2322_003829 [Rhodoblastus acidophilus]|uniref:hypothetical protein n=1 Tax=Rhodoblastus acidophilus TaxID=1074 RepID=UPI0022241F8C|nr:hypothetical protein [Rhodoblastus acidophilus]MCW2318262.1 hypothetical protein [Rhodoblastus acidophilus]